MCPLEISETLNMAPRTVSFALRKLLGRQLLKKIPNLHDMRRPKYHVDMEAAKVMLQQYSDAAITSPYAWHQKV
jgi:DNA-binding MarR family transcriptional regulator